MKGQRKDNYRGYVEKHHIIPKCVGGTDNKENIVLLTAEEHYLAHLLLIKIYPNDDGLVYAANRMTISSNKMVRNNKCYGWLKRKYQEVCRKRVGEKNPNFGKKWYYNVNTLEEGCFFERPDGWIRGRASKKINICKKCGQKVCKRKEICSNTARIKRFINNFGFDETVIGTDLFYKEYDRIVKKLEKEYYVDKLSVEELRCKYNINSNETMRRILCSLQIKRRSYKESVKNYYVGLV